MRNARCDVYVCHPWDDTVSFLESFANIDLALSHIDKMKEAYTVLGYHNLDKAFFRIQLRGDGS
jgi:hypothetical protein